MLNNSEFTLPAYAPQLESVQIVYITGTKVWAVIQCYFILDSNFYAIYIEKYFTKLKNAIMQDDTKERGGSRQRWMQPKEKRDVLYGKF